jgi:hypothetical protein
MAPHSIVYRAHRQEMNDDLFYHHAVLFHERVLVDRKK